MTCPRCKQERIVFTFSPDGKLICLRCADVAKLAPIMEFTRHSAVRRLINGPVPMIIDTR